MRSEEDELEALLDPQYLAHTEQSHRRPARPLIALLSFTDVCRAIFPIAFVTMVVIYVVLTMNNVVPKTETPMQHFFAQIPLPSVPWMSHNATEPDVDDGGPEVIVRQRQHHSPSPSPSPHHAPPTHPTPASIKTNKCFGPIQAGETLRFGVERPMVDSVCCKREVEAERRGFMKEMRVFEQLRKGTFKEQPNLPRPTSSPPKPGDPSANSDFQNRTYTFYDPVCGKALFEAPRHRSFGIWAGDSVSAGWLAFRDDDVIQGNVVVDPTTHEIHSSCGTYLGRQATDQHGSQLLANLVCLSGHPLTAAASSNHVPVEKLPKRASNV